jgi:hypothetical protein
MDTRLRIDNRRSPPRFAFSDKANGVPLTFVLDLPEGIILGGKVNGHAHIEGQGHTPRALAASLNGEILYEMGEARLVEAGLKMVSADLLSGILDSLSPSSSKKGNLSEGEYTDYRCSVFGIGIKDGMVRSDRAIAMESEKFNIGGDGYVDLRKETIGFAIRPKAKTGLGLSVGTLLGGFAVGGTLSSPKVQLNRRGVAVTATVGPVVHPTCPREAQDRSTGRLTHRCFNPKTPPPARWSTWPLRRRWRSWRRTGSGAAEIVE